MPSPPVAVLASMLIATTYTLVVPGRPRDLAKLISGLLIGAFVGARLYLAIDHPSDDVVAVAIGVAIPLLLFRTFAPQEVFPVAYRKGKTAHLDVSGPRGEAIRRAVLEQLGVEVAELGHIGLAGSGGSTPIAEMLDLYAVTCRERACPPLAVSSDDIAAVRSRIEQLDRQWQALAVGSSMTLEM